MMLDRSLRLREQKKGPLVVLRSSGYLLRELVIASVLSPLEVEEASIRYMVEVVSNGITLGSQTILNPVSFEVGLDARPR